MLSVALVASAKQAAYINFAPLVTQLNPVEDPDDCRSIKAYKYGAAIGIIVAVIVVLALLIGGWVYWYRRSSRKVSTKARLGTSVLQAMHGYCAACFLGPPSPLIMVLAHTHSCLTASHQH